VVAAQSEIHYIQDGFFFILSRDSNAGHGQASSLSVYRHIDIFDFASATDISISMFDCANCTITRKDGILSPFITPAIYCSFLDYNINNQLGRFGLHNGGPQDEYLLNEVTPLTGQENDPNAEYYVFSLSDNDFIQCSLNSIRIVSG
jgi:hypothetical protein